jgi:hypothetical protein
MITLDEFVERLCRLGADGASRRFPRSTRDREILMQSVVMQLDSERSYNEKEINGQLVAWSRDVAPSIDVEHVTLRRLLVDYQRLERTADGASYRVGFPARTVAFELGVFDLDQRATVAAYRDHVEGQRRRRKAKAAAAS